MKNLRLENHFKRDFRSREKKEIQALLLYRKFSMGVSKDLHKLEFNLLLPLLNTLVEFSTEISDSLGMSRAVIKEAKQTVTLPFDKNPVYVPIELALSEYSKYIKDESVFTFRAYAKVNNGQATVLSRDFEFKHPEIQVLTVSFEFDSQIVIVDSDKFTQGKDGVAR